MSAISTWSSVAANNNSAAPDGAPEGWAPSSVNDTIRELMAQIRTQMEIAEWFEWGDSPTYASGTTFTVAGDLTGRYTVGRRIWINGTTPGDIYGTITASSYSAPNTTVTVSFDSGSMSNEAITAKLAILDPTSPSFDKELSDIAQLAVTDGNFIVGNGTTWVAESGATARASLGAGAVGENLITAATAAAAQQAMNTEVGVDVQAYDADLTTLGGLAKTDGNFIVGNGSAWVAENGATARTSLGLTIGTNVQAYDSDLQALANNATSGLLTRTGAGAATARTITGASGISVSNGNGVSGNPSISPTYGSSANTVAQGNDSRFVTNGNSHNHLGGDGAAIPEGGLAASAVDQSSLKTALQQNTGSLTVSGYADITFTGGAYCFRDGFTDDTSTQLLFAYRSMYTNTSYAWGVGIAYQGGGTNNYYIQMRYVQASPPYNIGNGDIPLFLFAIVDNNGDVIAVDAAQDPPWANNGPTNIRPDFIENGKKYKVIKKHPVNRRNIDITNPASRENYLSALKSEDTETIEITTQYKNSDMGLIPHPYGAPRDNSINNGVNKIVLLDPYSKAADDLYHMQNDGEDVSRIAKDYMTVGTQPLSGVVSPNGVICTSVKWRNMP